MAFDLYWIWYKTAVSLQLALAATQVAARQKAAVFARKFFQ